MQSNMMAGVFLGESIVFTTYAVGTWFFGPITNWWSYPFGAIVTLALSILCVLAKGHGNRAT